MHNRNQPGTYRVVTFHAVDACCGDHAEEQIATAYPQASVQDEATALLATSDGQLVEVPELCGHVHAGEPVLIYDGEFRTEVTVS